MLDTVLGTVDIAVDGRDTGPYPHEAYVPEKPKRHADMWHKTK